MFPAAQKGLKGIECLETIRVPTTSTVALVGIDAHRSIAVPLKSNYLRERVCVCVRVVKNER